MKQLTKSGEVLGKLRAQYGVDANLDNLAVYEVVLANTQPLRKTGGLFKGARLASSLLAEIVNAVNAESVPIQLQHKTDTIPFGRLFAAQLLGDEARGLIAVDKVAHPDIVQKLDTGTLDQVSVGMVNKHLLCSQCGFDYAKPEAYEARFDLACDKGHKLGEAGVHLLVSGLDSLFETSLVGQGAVRGARVLGPSESAFKDNPRLAASSAADNQGGIAVHLTATVEDTSPMDLTAALGKIENQATQLGTVQANLATTEAARAALETQLATANTDLAAVRAELDALKTGDLAQAVSAKEAAEATAAAAVTALTSEVKLVLTAMGKSEADIDAAIKDKDAAALLSILTENRAQFAAVIVPGGKSAAADTDGTQLKSTGSAGAFRSPRR